MRRIGDRHPGAEHILLGILSNEDEMAVRILDRLDASAEALEERLFEVLWRTNG